MSDILTHVLQVKYFPLVALDPLAWQAVGKVEGWSGRIIEYPKSARQGDRFGYIIEKMTQADVNMHRMIDTLCEGRSIEQFLETL